MQASRLTCYIKVSVLFQLLQDLWLAVKLKVYTVNLMLAVHVPAEGGCCFVLGLGFFTLKLSENHGHLGLEIIICGLLTAEYQGLTEIKFLSAGGFVFPHTNINILRSEALQAVLPQHFCERV